VYPVPEDVYRLCADEYLYTLAPVFGDVAALDAPVGSYRLHDSNNYSSLSPRQKLQVEVESHRRQCESVAHALHRHGILVDQDAWRRNSWFHRLQHAFEIVTNEIPVGARFLVADEDSWESEGLFEHWDAVPATTLTDAGGPPGDDQAAVGLLPSIFDYEYVVFGWPSFWWFDVYPKFGERLTTHYEPVVTDDVIRVFRRRTTVSPLVGTITEDAIPGAS
jgi:hypothetical protein